MDSSMEEQSDDGKVFELHPEVGEWYREHTMLSWKRTNEERRLARLARVNTIHAEISKRMLDKGLVYCVDFEIMRDVLAEFSHKNTCLAHELWDCLRGIHEDKHNG